MTNQAPPATTARKVVAAWRAASWGETDVATPWNALVDAYGQDEASSLVYLALEARGYDEPSYELFSIKRYARRQSGEDE